MTKPLKNRTKGEQPTGNVLYVGGTDQWGNLMVILDVPHECGWPELITYIDDSGNPVRTGCAGCDEELPSNPPDPADLRLVSRIFGTSQDG